MPCLPEVIPTTSDQYVVESRELWQSDMYKNRFMSTEQPTVVPEDLCSGKRGRGGGKGESSP